MKNPKEFVQKVVGVKNRRDVIVVLTSFKPPFLSKRALDASIISIRELLRNCDPKAKTTREAVLNSAFFDAEHELLRIYKRPSWKTIAGAFVLSETNQLILANV